MSHVSCRIQPTIDFVFTRYQLFKLPQETNFFFYNKNIFFFMFSFCWRLGIGIIYQQPGFIFQLLKDSFAANIGK